MALSPEFLELQYALAGEYSIERELGRGGMGVVYLARDVQLDREVAIKVLPSNLARLSESRARFLREARTAAGLSHPHIVPIHAVGEVAGFVYFVMSYIAGETLGERLRRAGPMSGSETLRVMREVAWALAYAHGRGIVHRDVKPDNILLERDTGRALVTDFGIAHAATGDITDPGRVMGTAQFMSPEQAANAPLDGRSDIYSLGVVGYLALSGRLPFETSSVPALLVRQATEAAPPVLRAAPGALPLLAQAVDRCLARDPAMRFDSGEALADALAPVSARHPLPAQLRTWLAIRNPAQSYYAAWSTVGCSLTAIEVAKSVVNESTFGQMGDVWMLCFALAPLVPITGFHVGQARRLFKSGFSIGDLRNALDVALRERQEGQSHETAVPLGIGRQLLRAATYVSVPAWVVIQFFYEWTNLTWSSDVRNPTQTASIIAMLALLGMSNMLEVPLLPGVVRRGLRTGLRERLWQSRAGACLARMFGAPETSRVVGAGAFQPTETVLGLAAADLFSALPAHLRANLAHLPATIAALESRAGEARAAHQGGHSAAGAHRLSSAVAALESIRLSLLQLHADADDLAPLTTLIDAAHLLGDDVSRLVAARREVDQLAPRRPRGLDRVPTPA